MLLFCIYLVPFGHDESAVLLQSLEVMEKEKNDVEKTMTIWIQTLYMSDETQHLKRAGKEVHSLSACTQQYSHYYTASITRLSIHVIISALPEYDQ